MGHHGRSLPYVPGGYMPSDIRTDATLLARLRNVASVVMTSEQIRRQRLSFIHGSLPHGSTLSLAEIEDALEQHEGTRQVA